MFIIYTTIDNFSGIDSKKEFNNELNLLNENIIYIAGTSSMSFLLQFLFILKLFFKRVIPSIPAIFKE